MIRVLQDREDQFSSAIQRMKSTIEYLLLSVSEGVVHDVFQLFVGFKNAFGVFVAFFAHYTNFTE